MKAGYRYKKKRSLRTISTKFVHHKITKSPNKTHKTTKRRKRRRIKTHKIRKGRKRRKTNRK
jgi:hypothetical protein